MNPTITLSGVDSRITSADLRQLLTWPAAELGLLYTATPEGRNRYPDAHWLVWAAEIATGRCAVHVCGHWARAQLLAGELGDMLRHAARIQVNGLVSVDMAERICEQYPHHTIITQHHASNVALLNVQAPNHALLVDASGGAGKLPTDWLRPDTPKRVGFAGGLGPHNLGAHLPLIAAAANRNPYWVDMENRLRQEDWFDMGAARSVLEIHARFSAPPKHWTPPHADRRRRP